MLRADSNKGGEELPLLSWQLRRARKPLLADLVPPGLPQGAGSLEQACPEEIVSDARLLGLEDDVVQVLCNAGLLALKALKPVVDGLGAGLASVTGFEIDAEGPRVIVRLRGREGECWREAYVDMSPDGVELVVVVAGRRGLRREEYEDAVGRAVEDSPEFAGIEEYDVSYDPGTGEVVLTLHARLLAELPGIGEVCEVVEKAVGYL